MSLIICSTCRVALRCIKNEKVVRMEQVEIKYGDEYVCPICGIKIITGFGGSIFPNDPTYEQHLQFVEVEGVYG